MKKILLWLVAITGLLLAVGALFVTAKDRQMDSAPLVERLRVTAVPTELMLVDEWNFDGDWLFKPRQPEAVRKYVASGEIEDWCNLIDDFYTSRSIQISPTQRSDDPTDWCGRSLRVPGRISIWVEPAPSWVVLPEGVEQPAVQITYYALR